VCSFVVAWALICWCNVCLISMFFAISGRGVLFVTSCQGVHVWPAQEFTICVYITFRGKLLLWKQRKYAWGSIENINFIRAITIWVIDNNLIREYFYRPVDNCIITTSAFVLWYTRIKRISWYRIFKKHSLPRWCADQESPLVAAASGLNIGLREFIFTHKFATNSVSKVR
jgi:hypothetical protein